MTFQGHGLRRQVSTRAGRWPLQPVLASPTWLCCFWGPRAETPLRPGCPLQGGKAGGGVGGEAPLEPRSSFSQVCPLPGTGAAALVTLRTGDSPHPAVTRSATSATCLSFPIPLTRELSWLPSTRPRLQSVFLDSSVHCERALGTRREPKLPFSINSLIDVSPEGACRWHGHLPTSAHSQTFRAFPAHPGGPRRPLRGVLCPHVGQVLPPGGHLSSTFCLEKVGSWSHSSNCEIFLAGEVWEGFLKEEGLR